MNTEGSDESGKGFPLVGENISDKSYKNRNQMVWTTLILALF